MNFIFKSEVKFHERLKTRLENHNKFDNDYSYITLSLGNPYYTNHFCKYGCEGFHNEVLSSTTMNMDLIPLLFFDDEYLVDTKLGAWGNYVWTIRDGRYFSGMNKLKAIDKEGLASFSDWLYFKSKPWPSEDGVYVDGRRIVVLLEDDKKYIYGRRVLEVFNF